VILAGPPGTGKTTLAKIIAEKTSASFIQLNAVMSGVKELKEVCSNAAAIHGSTMLTTGASLLLPSLKKRTILFIDENPSL
jgi:putative ATPase